MKMNNQQQLKNHNSKLFSGKLFLAVLIMLGVASCNGGESTENVEDNLAEETTVAEGLNENVVNERDENFSRWDKNADQQWDLDEFEASLENEGLYEDLDSDGNEILAENEFHNSFYDQWDENDDEILNSDEYAAGFRNWEAEYGNNFDKWDINKNKELERDEFETGMREMGIYRDWDVDQSGDINRGEYYEGIYNYRDADRNRFLSSEELDPTELYINE